LNTLRLSFVTVPPEDIDRGIALLAQAIGETMPVQLRTLA